MTSALRLADLLGGLSMVADLGYGLPPQEALRGCVASTAFARHLGLPEERVRDAFYAALLMHIGCVATAIDGSRTFGDEIRLTQLAAVTNLSDWRDIGLHMMPALTRGMSPLNRVRTLAYGAVRGAAWGRAADEASCEIARDVARRLGLPASTQRPLLEMYAWWNGQGPTGRGGDDIDIVARLIVVASDAAYFDDVEGPEGAVRMLRGRIGVLDPDLVEDCIVMLPELLKEVNSFDPRSRVMEIEPDPVVAVPPEQLAGLAAVFGDATDMKTPCFHGNSQRIAQLACAAATSLKLGANEVSDLNIAALLHDVGRAGVTSRIWEKEGPLTSAEWEQVRMHAYHSERILSGSDVLAPLARLAGMHHERPDGSGYHRGARAGELPMAARVLAAADAFVAMTSERPHRGAMAPEQAASELGAGARSGRLDSQAVAAVLDAAGHAAPAGTAVVPGLSTREIDVLRLVAQGLSNAEVAASLHISRRTAEHHIQHIYTKIGVSSRAAATMFGLEHGLLAH